MDVPTTIRQGDLDSLRHVGNYLENFGLQVAIRGSATFRRDYHDIDLLVTGTSEQVSQGYFGLVRAHAISEHQRFPQAISGRNYSVEQVGGKQLYLNTTIENRVAVSAEGISTIDVCFRSEE
ncbi:hypothetical protein HYX12_03665 [Candidatus Woesearchaeota archaeon]|nr:hypothetical protein [Candidatus Woesearchaeota archaeon]